jgi:hypothetical protein
MVNNKSIQKGQDDKQWSTTFRIDLLLTIACRLVFLGLICWPLLVVLSFLS